MSATSLAEIEDFVRKTRALHEHLLGVSDIEGTAGTCLHASFILQMTLAKFLNCSAWVCGGGNGDGGARDSQGRLQGHYWVEGTTASGEHFVADITADQFGHAPVYFALAVDSRERYVPGDARIMREVLADFAKELQS